MVYKILFGLILAASFAVAQPIPAPPTVKAASSPWVCKPTGGSATAYVCTPTLLDGTAIPIASLRSPANGQQLIFIPDVDNGSNPTIKIDGLNARGTAFCPQCGENAFPVFALTANYAWLFNWSTTSNEWIYSNFTVVQWDNSTIQNMGDLFQIQLRINTNLRLTSIIGIGTVPVITGCGNISDQAGGTTFGTFTTDTTGTCAAAFALPTASHGWVCNVTDLTKHLAANIMLQSASSTTSCTVTGTTAASDVLQYNLFAY